MTNSNNNLRQSMLPILAVTPTVQLLILSGTQPMAKSALRSSRRNTAVKRRPTHLANRHSRVRNRWGLRLQATRTREVKRAINCVEQVSQQAGMRFEIESSPPALPSTLQLIHRQKTYEIIWIPVRTKRSPEMKQPQIITASLVHVEST